MERTQPRGVFPFTDVVGQFALEGHVTEAVPYGSGHINDTYCVRVDSSDGKVRRYIFQRINHRVFQNIEGLMDNIDRVTRHLRNKLTANAEADAARQALHLVPTRDQKTYARSDGGEYWRVYDFIEGASTYDVCRGPDQAYEAAKAFGRFQAMLVDLPGPRLVETLPYFHHTPRRLEALRQAIQKDARGRHAEVQHEIAFCEARAKEAGVIVEAMEQGRLAERTTHNDTKLNNVLIEDRTGRGLCVIDLDTVMPGSVLYDFGDMVRTFTPTAAEDETDLEKVMLDMNIFDGLAEGYLTATGEFLTPAERQYLVCAGKLITFTIGIRFLTDYLAGDVYFKIARPRQNLERARTQFKMVSEIEARQKEMERRVMPVTRICLGGGCRGAHVPAQYTPPHGD